MAQLLLFPDPRPLVERLGLEFFRQAPQRPGVYLMRDASDSVLYVGKARNLRRRLASYRVANPDRLRRRHLRLLRAIARIELQECPDELSALARESWLLRTLRPRFNRAGTWPGLPRFLAWKAREAGLELAVLPAADPGWAVHGPLGPGAIPMRATLTRLLWCALHAERSLASMPPGWFHGRHGATVTIPRLDTSLSEFENAGALLQGLFAGEVDEFVQWVRARTLLRSHPFETTVREADLETLLEFIVRKRPRKPPVEFVL